MSEQKMDCPMCRTNISVYPDYDTVRVFYRCPVCGRYELGHNGLAKFDHNHLAPYLYYNRYLSDEFTEYRYHTDLSKEEGYAMGLGKPVIQLCRKETQLHFDIAQKNTIMWGTENDIPELLANRIKATID